jgi:hypothetical protein
MFVILFPSFYSFPKTLVEFEQFILNVQAETMETFTLALHATTSLRDRCKGALIKLFLATADNCGVSRLILRMNFLQLLVTIRTSHFGGDTNSFGRQL